MRKYKKLFIGIMITVFFISSIGLTLPSAHARTDSLIKRALINGSYASPSYVASKADVFLIHDDWGPIVPQIHSIRPDLTVLLYRNLRAVSKNSDAWNLALQNNWILRDAQGNYLYDLVFPSLVLVDKGNPSYQQWVAQWLKNNIDTYGYNGVYADCSGYVSVNEDAFDSNWWAGWVGPPINPRTGNVYTEPEWRAGEISLANTIKSYIGSKLLIQNGVFCGSFFFQRPYSEILQQSRVDGTVSEGWMMDLNNAQWYTEAQWQDAINFESWMGNTLFPQKPAGTFFAVAQNPNPLDNSAPFLPPGTSKDQFALFVYSSLLLGATTNGNIYLNLGLYSDSDYVQSLFNIDVGYPTNNYYMISGTHVYARDFTNVKVLVNPTYTTYTVNLNGNYRTTDGVSVGSSVTVYPHSAVILEPVASVTTWQPWTYTYPSLTVLPTQNGYTLQPGTYTYPTVDGNVWLVARPSPGYTFDYWIIDGNAVPAQYYEPDGDFTYYLIMDSDHTVQAFFKPINTYSSYTSQSSSTTFQDGFETGDFSKWASTYTTSDAIAEVYPFAYSGTYSARFKVPGSSGSRAYSYYKSYTGMSTVAVSMHVNTGDMPIEPWKSLWLVQAISGSGSVLASYGIRNDGGGAKWATSSQGVNSFATSGPTPWTWYKIDAYYTRSASGETIAFYVNGIKVSQMNVDTSGSGVAALRTGIAYYDSGPSTRVYIDNVEVYSE
ncbi:MAG TPA: putative glycoside hydrolase [Candidatus Sulfotelmatobacter sp.]|nr:putative glycoside hydrolase [Candidatus Sulfotelmatobacter sp.]